MFFCSCRIVLGFFYMFYIMFFWLEPKEPKVQGLESPAKILFKSLKSSQLARLELRRTTSLGFGLRLKQEEFLRLLNKIS